MNAPLTTVESDLNILKITIKAIMKKEIKLENIRQALKLPVMIFEGTGLDKSLLTIANVIDRDHDGNYTANDFKLLAEDFKNFNLSLIGQAVTTTVSLLMSIIKLKNLKLSDEQIISLIINLILYATLIPIMTSKNASEWANQITGSDNKTNLDCLFEFLDIVYTFLISADFVKDAVKSIINFISKKCSCCCKKSSNETLNALREQDIIMLKARAYDDMQAKKIKTDVIISEPTVAPVAQSVSVITLPVPSQ